MNIYLFGPNPFTLSETLTLLLLVHQVKCEKSFCLQMSLLMSHQRGSFHLLDHHSNWTFPIHILHSYLLMLIHVGCHGNGSHLIDIICHLCLYVFCSEHDCWHTPRANRGLAVGSKLSTPELPPPLLHTPTPSSLVLSKPYVAVTSKLDKQWFAQTVVCFQTRIENQFYIVWTMGLLTQEMNDGIRAWEGSMWAKGSNMMTTSELVYSWLAQVPKAH